MNTRIRIIALGAAGILVLGLLLSLVHNTVQGSTTSWASAVPIPQTLTTSAPYGQDSIVFSNGRSFVTLNYLSGKTTLLSNDNNNSDLEGIDQISVSPDQKYILFRDPTASLGSIFDTQLKAQNLNSSQPYWWVYNIATKTYQNLAQNTLAAAFANGNLYTLSQKGSASAISTFNLPTMKQLISISVPQSSGFFPLPDGYLLTSSEDENVLETTDGSVNTQLFGSANILNVAPDGKTLLMTQTKDNHTSLETYNLQTKAVAVISTDASIGQATWTAQNSVIYSQGGQGQGTTQLTYYLYDAGTGKSTRLKFTADAFKKTQPSPSALLTNGTGIATNNGTTYLVGNNIHSINQTSDYDKQINVNGKLIEIEYYSDQTAFIITLNAPTADAEKQAVYAQLRKDGLDPYLLDIRFTILTPLQISGR